MNAQHGFVNSSPESCKQALRMNLARVYHIFACMCFRSVSQHLFDQGTNDHHAWLFKCEPSTERHMNTHLTQLTGGLMQAGCNHMLCQSEIHTQHTAQRSNNICDGISAVLCTCAFYWRLHDVSFGRYTPRPVSRCKDACMLCTLVHGCSLASQVVRGVRVRHASQVWARWLAPHSESLFRAKPPSLLLTAFRRLFLKVVC